MLRAREGGVGGLREGMVSIRYMRINPLIKDIPIQAWGVRVCVCSNGGEGLDVSSTMWISPGAMGVLGGSVVAWEAVCGPGGKTGPGSALIASSMSPGWRRHKVWS